MAQLINLQERINRHFSELSGKLQVAAKYVSENPADIATRSLRAVAATSGVSPATFSRLARALGYDDYEQMREENRSTVERKMAPFSERASALRQKAGAQKGRAILQHQSAACIANIETMAHSLDTDALELAVAALDNARTVLLLGSMGSAGIVHYLGYMGQWFNSNWHVAGRNGTEISATLSRMGAGDVVLALTKAPYARRTVAGLKAAREKGVVTIVVTDRVSSPALQFGVHSFIVPTESPQFFSSYAATLVFMETVMSMLIARAGPEAEDLIRAAELQIERLGENWTP